MLFTTHSLLRNLQIDDIVRIGASRTVGSTLNCLASVSALAFSFVAVGSTGLMGSSTSHIANQAMELPGKQGAISVQGLDFNPDGTLVAVIGGGVDIVVWDWRRARVLHTLQMPDGSGNGLQTNPLAFSPDGKWFAGCVGKGRGDVVVRVWNTDTWSVATDLKDPEPGGCNAMAFTPDGRFLLYAITRAGLPLDNVIGYALPDWKLAWRTRIPNFGPVSLAVNPNGSLVAVSGTTAVVPTGISDPVERFRQSRLEPTIAVLDEKNGQLVKTVRGNALGPIAWSPDGEQLAIAGNLYVEIFDSGSWQRLLHERVDKSAHMNIWYSPAGGVLVESDSNGRGTGLGVRLWNSERTTLLQHIPGDAGTIAFSRDGSLLGVTFPGRTSIWRIASPHKP